MLRAKAAEEGAFVAFGVVIVTTPDVNAALVIRGRAQLVLKSGLYPAEKPVAAGRMLRRRQHNEAKV